MFLEGKKNYKRLKYSSMQSGNGGGCYVKALENLGHHCFVAGARSEEPRPLQETEGVASTQLSAINGARL